MPIVDMREGKLARLRHLRGAKPFSNGAEIACVICRGSGIRRDATLDVKEAFLEAALQREHVLVDTLFLDSEAFEERELRLRADDVGAVGLRRIRIGEKGCRDCESRSWNVYRQDQPADLPST